MLNNPALNNGLSSVPKPAIIPVSISKRLAVKGLIVFELLSQRSKSSLLIVAVVLAEMPSREAEIVVVPKLRAFANPLLAVALLIVAIPVCNEAHTTDVLNSKCVIIGSPTLNNNMLPTVGAFLTYLKGLNPQKKIGVAFISIFENSRCCSVFFHHNVMQNVACCGERSNQDSSDLVYNTKASQRW